MATKTTRQPKLYSRPHHVTLRVTTTEKERMIARQKQAGFPTLGDFIRHVAIGRYVKR